MALFLQRVQTVGSSLISAMVKYLELSAQRLKYFYNQISGAKKSSSTSHILFSRLSIALRTSCHVVNPRGYSWELLWGCVALQPRPSGGTPHMKGVGMLVGNFELNS